MIKTTTYLDNIVIKETIMSPYSVTVEDCGEVWEVRCIEGHVSSFNPTKDFSVAARFNTRQEAEKFYTDLIVSTKIKINNGRSILNRSIISQ